MICKCCEVLKKENEHIRKWIDRLMEEKSPDPDPQGDTIPDLANPSEDLKEVQQFGE